MSRRWTRGVQLVEAASGVGRTQSISPPYTGVRLAARTFGGKTEKRGRNRILSSADAKKLERTRHRLIGEADNSWPVTHAYVAQESGFDGRARPRVIADALRARGVRSRTPRAKVLSAGCGTGARLSSWVEGGVDLQLA